MNSKSKQDFGLKRDSNQEKVQGKFQLATELLVVNLISEKIHMDIMRYNFEDLQVYVIGQA